MKQPKYPELQGIRNTSTWNRSSAFSPDILAMLTEATKRSIEKGIRLLKTDARFAYMSDKQRTKAVLLLAKGVTRNVEKFAMTLRKRNITGF